MAYPRDRFDDLPDDLRRIGAHRTPRKPRRWWVGFLLAALATLVLIVVGLVALKLAFNIDIRLPFVATSETAAPTPAPTSTPTSTATPEPVTDPTTIDPARNIKVSIYNGTPTAELQNTVGDALATDGWPIDVRALASTEDVEKTTVYYSDAANEDVARGLVAALGIGDIQLVSPDTFPGSPVTVVIGLDYPGATPEG